ncbi:MAG: VanW family protein [Clostridia bacterium]|nr:VanW family protein [Clostridia bacterium]
MALEEKEKKENEELNTNNSKIEEVQSSNNETPSETSETSKKIESTKSDENQKELLSQEQPKVIEDDTSTPKDEIKTEESSDSETTDNEKNSSQVQPETSIGHFVFKICENIVFTLIAILVIAFTIFTIVNTNNSIISSGISILGIDVSGLDREAATDKISTYVQDKLDNNDIILKHNEYETNIAPEQIETKINVLSAIDAAFDIGSGNNIFANSFKKLSLLINHVDIKPTFTINTEQLDKTLSDISTQLPDAVKQSDYYIDGNNLVVTAGKSGVVIDNSKMIEAINSQLGNLSYTNGAIEIATIEKEPDKLNIEKIYNEVHKDAVNAHYDAITHIVYPEENGLDFKISLEEAKAMLNETKEEYVIPLQTLKPSVTTNMIGMEAFPDLLSSFSTRYPASNRDRTTNLKLAASKVNGTVVLPGQTFSYNAVVGERTIAAGYKEAAVYQDGQVVQGLGGGICQISTTLYNAALYANLDIVERRNHQFVPSYIGAGRDATVVYGSQDFKFKNNRNYAIKITCSVDKGVATFNIYGLKEDSDCEVTITSGITSRGTNSFTSATYKTLKRNGQVISSTTISRDTYKVHH